MTTPKKPPARKRRGPSKKYAPPIPAEQIDAMIWALHFHRLPIGDQDHQSLPYEAARAIAALLYLIRDGPLPKSSKRNTHDKRKALVARELIVTFRLAKPDAIGAAYFDEIEAARKRDDPTKVIEACTRRFERHAAAISSLEGRRQSANPASAKFLVNVDPIFSLAIGAAKRTEAGRAALEKLRRQQKPHFVS